MPQIGEDALPLGAQRACASASRPLFFLLLSCRSILLASFASHDAFAAALRGALEAGINSRENKPAELLGGWSGEGHCCVLFS